MSKGKQAETLYISTGCNRYSNVADIREQDGLVAYGAGRLVALWRSEETSRDGVYQTLVGHEGTVTTLKFLHRATLKSNSQVTSFVSGDTAGKFILWHEREDRTWHPHQTLSCSASVGSLACLELLDGSHLIAIGTSDAAIRLLQFGDKEGVKELQVLHLKGKMPMDIAFSYLPNSEALVMAVGGTDTKIHLYTRPSGSSLFTSAIALPGHVDWVRCLQFSESISAESASLGNVEYRSGDILLASGSQDNFVRLWRFTTTRQSTSLAPGTNGQGKSALDILDSLDEEQDGEIAAKQYTMAVEGEDTLFACNSESVLLGHDNWVTGLHWHHGDTGTIPRLLTASADRSMILWTQDPASSVWLTSHRFGEIGGTNLGFFGALWGSKGDTVLAHGWGGSFHVWSKEKDMGVWSPVISISGHFEEVTSLAWEPEGEYLVTVSGDQTARLHAPWRRDGTVTWHEQGRPQIHGYDMEDVAFVSRLRFISGSEEKIVRVFDAPAVFVESMKRLGVSQSLHDDGARPNAATVPALGLSNKAVFESQAISELNGTASGTAETVTFQALAQPPFEEQLLTSTLWPETEKLYGHGYEINAVAASHDGRLIASACRSTTPEHAVIRLFNTSNWSQVPSLLAGHSLTITRIAFSPDDRFILSVSRDRSWHIFERQSGDGDRYVRVSGLQKAHARIIWDCAWSLDGSIFATASRDKQVKIWQGAAEDGPAAWLCIATLVLPDAATSVAFTTRGASHALAIGTEAGQIHVHSATFAQPQTWARLGTLDKQEAHDAMVTRVAWRPVPRAAAAVAAASDAQDSSETELPLLASCSDDHSVRITQLSL